MVLTTAWSSLVRLAHFGWVVTRHAVTVGLGELARRLPGLGGLLPPPPSGPRRLRVLLEDLGGSFIKFGQVLALQPDILPRAYCDELFDLMDRMPPFGVDGVERIFREELGRAPREVFDAFEDTPIASASIAQVHAAWLDGRKLAVKVQRPNARREFGGDILLMRWVTTCIRRLRLSRFDWLARALGEFVSWTGEELDFNAEARFMDQLAANSKDRDSERVPEVQWSLTTGRILTSEFLEGTTLLQYFRSLEQGDSAVRRRLAGVGFEPEGFARNALENFLHDVFNHGVFHADLHPANLLILPNNTVGYVDFGISGVVSEHSRNHLVQMILALTRSDAAGAAEGLLALSEVRPDSDAAGFRRAIERQGESWFGRSAEGGRLGERTSYTEVLLDMLVLNRSYRVVPHAEGMRYLRSVVTLEGLIGRFAPGLEIDEILESSCSALLASRSLSAPLEFDRWVDWLSAATRLVRDGPARVDRALDRLERQAGRGHESPRARRPRGRGGRLLQLGIAAAVLALLIGLSAETPRFGFNLFTAELAVFGTALLLLTREALLWRPSRG